MGNLLVTAGCALIFLGLSRQDGPSSPGTLHAFRGAPGGGGGPRPPPPPPRTPAAAGCDAESVLEGLRRSSSCGFRSRGWQRSKRGRCGSLRSLPPGLPLRVNADRGPHGLRCPPRPLGGAHSAWLAGQAAAEIGCCEETRIMSRMASLYEEET